MGARAVNAVLGFWLFLSALLWEHGSPQFFNAAVVGTLVVSLAVLLSGASWTRMFSAMIGGWLIISSLLWPPLRGLTYWNHMFVGAAIALFAIAPSLSALRRRRQGPA